MRRLPVPASLIARLESDLRARGAGQVQGVDDGAADEQTQLLVERAVQALEPDPLFRRRLRGEFLNRHVAAREGHLPAPHRRREMGKLGRACLYASLMVVLSVSAAGAASQDSLPGDALYGVKIQLEDVRMRLAHPSLQPQLSIHALDERVEELDGLLGRADWHLVPAAANRVVAAALTVAELDAAAAVPSVARADAVLQRVMAAAPPSARPGLERAVAKRARTRPNAGADASAPPRNGGAAGGGGQPGTGPANGQPDPRSANGGQGPSHEPQASPAQRSKPPAPTPPPQGVDNRPDRVAPGSSGAPSATP